MNSQPLLRAAISLYLSFTLTACGSSLMLPDARTAPLSALAQTIDKQGLSLTLDPWLDKGRTEKFFGFDARDSDVVILYLKAKNVASDSAFLLRTDHFKLAASANENPNSGNNLASGSGPGVGVVAGTLLGGAFVLAPFISLPFILVAMNKGDELNEIRGKIADNTFLNQSISPGQATDGFLYFKLASKQKLQQGASLIVDVTELRSQQTFQIEMPLPNEN